MMKNSGFKIILTLFIVGLLVFGGWSISNSAKPQRGDFVLVGNLSIPRYNHETVLLNDGRVLIIGGGTQSKHYEGNTISAEIYNPDTKKFISVGNMNSSHGEFSLTKLNDGKVLIVGGSGKGNTSANAELFDPKTNKFQFTGKLNYPRQNHTTTLLGDGRVLIVGGYGHTGLHAKRQAEIYNPNTGKFYIASNLNIPRSGHTAALLKDGRVLIVGGVGSSDYGFPLLSSTEVYNPNTNKFELAGNMNFARVKPDIFILKDGNVIVSGGIGKGVGKAIFIREIEMYNPKTNKFKVVIKRELAPNKPIPILLKDDRVLYTGGCTGVGLSLQCYRETEIYDPIMNEFIKGKDMNYPRIKHRMTVLKDGNVLVTGSEGIRRIAELYIYDNK